MTFRIQSCISVKRSPDIEIEFVVWPAVATIGVALAFILIALAWYWPTPEIAILSDNSPVSWLSSAQLWAIALIAFRLGIDRCLPLSASLWLGLAMVLLACDEQFMFHEHWKYGCHQWFSACVHVWVTELPIGIVALTGLMTVGWLHYLLPSRWVRVWLWASLAIGLLAIAVDLFGGPIALVRAEEAFEVISEAFMAGALIGIRVVNVKAAHEHSEI